MKCQNGEWEKGQEKLTDFESWYMRYCQLQRKWLRFRVIVRMLNDHDNWEKMLTDKGEFKRWDLKGIKWMIKKMRCKSFDYKRQYMIFQR